MTTDQTIPRPFLELEPIDPVAGALAASIWRVPGATVPDTTGGYQLLRAKTRAGFAGTLGDDDGGHELLGTTVAQPASTTVRIPVVLTGQPTAEGYFLAARAVNDTTTATRRSELSNVVQVRQLSDRQVCVPSAPTQLEPDRGALNGILKSIEDEETASGTTWWEFARVRLEVAEQTWESIMDVVHSEGEAATLFRLPPASLVRWYTAEVALELLQVAGLPPSRAEALEARWLLSVDRWRSAFFSGLVVHTPASSDVLTQLGTSRLIR